MKKEQDLFVVSSEELNAIGDQVKKLPLELSLNIWNALVNITIKNKIDDVLSSYSLREVPDSAQKVPKVKKNRK